MLLVGNFQLQITKPPQCANTGGAMVPTRAVRYHLHLDYITVPCKMHPFFKKGLIFMPAYYDEKTKYWYCKFYYMDYTRTEKQKKKRGFKL